MNHETSGSHAGCEDYEKASRLSRRGFLQGVAGAAGALAVAQTYGDTLMEASFGATGGNVLVVMSFRGGVDGLGLVVPHGDAGYYRARPNLAVPAASLVARDAMFGLHPEMAPLLPWWSGGKLAAVHAVGLSVPNRSHFKAIELVEDADPTSSVRRGWVNRMIGLGGIVGPLEATHLGSQLTPTMLAGPAATLATDSFASLQLSGLSATTSARRYGAKALTWGADGSPLGAAARSAVALSKGPATTLAAAYRPANGAVYPTEWPSAELAQSLRDAAHLIKLNVGTTVISIDFGNWDMHADYGNQTAGSMQKMVRAFSTSVAAFFKDLGPTWGERVTLATISEFGRRVAQNGNRGLDHGWGNAMLVMGGGVRGGQYFGTWPGLGDAKLVEGDLEVTTDYRNVLGEIVARRFPDRSLSQVFPGLTYAPVGVMA